MSQTEVRVLNSIPDDQVLHRDWNELVDQMKRPEVFYTYEWAIAIARAYSASLRPLLFLCYEQDRLIGVAALATNSKGEVQFLCATTADYCDFVSDPRHREHIISAVIANLRRRGCQSVVLANLPADSVSGAILGSPAARHGYRRYARPAYDCARVVLDSPEQRRVLRETISAKVKRKLSRLERIGDVSFVNLRSCEAVQQALPGFTTAHIARFLYTGRISSQAKAERRAFLSELAKELAAAGWLCLSELRVGEKPIAWNYGFQFAGSWFWYQPTFEPGFEQASPGYCLLAKIIEEACLCPETEIVDLGLGDEGYKDRFATTSRQTLHVTLSSKWLRHTGVRARQEAATWISKNPAAERIARSAMRTTANIAAHLRSGGIGEILHAGRKRAARMLLSDDAVVFYEYPAGHFKGADTNCSLHHIDFKSLARAAMIYEGDQQTLDYLLRAATRLRLRRSEGFALLDDAGNPVHLCWGAPFDGFYMDELGVSLAEPAPNSVLVFDCWTPSACRGQGYYASALQLVCRRVLAEGKLAWIFSAGTNAASIRGIEKAGFQKRFSLRRKKVLGIGRIEKHSVDPVMISSNRVDLTKSAESAR